MRALRDNCYDYYELTQDLGYATTNNFSLTVKPLLPKGTIFYHDKEDNRLGSPMEGCLKLCWDSKGNTQGCLCGDSQMFHAAFIHSDLFRLVQRAKSEAHEKIKKELETEIVELEERIREKKEALQRISYD